MTSRSDAVLLAGILSGSMSAFVVGSGLAFPKLMLDPSRVFSHLIWLISLTDLLGCLSLIFGLPENISPECHAQAFLYTFFFPASWFWTLLLVFQLRCALIYNRLWIKPWQMHVLVWSGSALCSFLPYTTGNYFGQDDEESGFLPCNYGGPPNAGYWWGVFTFSFVVFFTLFLMLYYIWEVNRHWRMPGFSVTPKQRAVYEATRYYPLAMCICWIPYVCTALLPPLTVTQIPDEWYFEMFLIFSTQYGTLIALIFFTHTPTITNRIFNFCTRKQDGEDSDRTSFATEQDLPSESFDGVDDAENISTSDSSRETQIEIQTTSPAHGRA